ncbi:MAG: hypothetical protein Q9160_005308 [Pyrenula sp. 1 TL-2023]
MSTDDQHLAYESKHVHEVYEQIASHFSSTRFKPWPIVERFLRGQRPGSVGLDIGCGNGKYLPTNQNVFIIASDRSHSLVDIARVHRPHSAIVADNLSLPHPDAHFDFVISIAVVHHLSTQERRIQAIQTMLETLSRSQASKVDQGQLLVFVWALEQKDSRRGWKFGDEQDVMVPWVMQHHPKNRSGSTLDETASSSKEKKTFQRYYHLYAAGELEQDIKAAGGTVLDGGYERDNWWAIATRSTPE